MLANQDLSERLLKFSAHVIKLLDTITQNKAGKEISGQIVRSAMSVGANYEEAKGSDSRPDFCNKLQIALKEMRETRYWLRLLDEASLLPKDTQILALLDEARQLVAILAKSVATARGKAKNSSSQTVEIASLRE